ncbi:MAG: DUF4442 domain-containing protein [Acidobacteriota bacterium]
MGSKRGRWLQRFRLRLIRIYPPFLGAGIRVREMNLEGGLIRVRMKLHFWNGNYFGTHFGGSLYSMCDPFYVLLLAHRLGPDYIVWDKAATIRFVRPGRGTVEATFRISDEEIDQIRHQAETQSKVEPLLHVDVLNPEGEVVARVEKVLYVRKKKAPPATAAGD